jgi:hypothetical protein
LYGGRNEDFDFLFYDTVSFMDGCRRFRRICNFRVEAQELYPEPACSLKRW